jgi:hypothetical protein
MGNICLLIFGTVGSIIANEYDTQNYLQVEKFYSKQYSDKEEGLRLLKEELRALVSGDSNLDQQHTSPNKIARASIFLLHRALRDKVYAVYSLAAEAIRLFFAEFVPTRYSHSKKRFQAVRNYILNGTEDSSLLGLTLTSE